VVAARLAMQPHTVQSIASPEHYTRPIPNVIPTNNQKDASVFDSSEDNIGSADNAHYTNKNSPSGGTGFMNTVTTVTAVVGTALGLTVPEKNPESELMRLKEQNEKMKRAIEEHKREKKRIEKQVKQQDKDIEGLKTEVRTWKEKHAKSETEIHIRESDIRLIKDRHARDMRSIKSENDRSRVEANNLRNTVNTQRSQIERLGNDIKDLQGVKQDLISQQQKYHAQQDRQEEELRKVQKAALRLLDDGKWQPESATNIQTRLGKFAANAKEWAQRNCVETLDRLSEEDRKNLQEYLKFMVKYDGEWLPKALECDAMKVRTPRILLCALLMDFVSDRVLARPLFFLETRLKSISTVPKLDNPGPEGITSGMEKLLEELIKSMSRHIHLVPSHY
jgi:hypothetical protein